MAKWAELEGGIFGKAEAKKAPEVTRIELEALILRAIPHISAAKKSGNESAQELLDDIVAALKVSVNVNE